MRSDRSCLLKNVLESVCLILIFVLLINCGGSVECGPGVMAPNDPVQIKLTNAEKITLDDYTITPLADFRVTARVLSKKRYRFGRGAKLSPYDLALGWGRMSDESVLKDIDVSQRNRWYWWEADKYPIPRREIETHSGNMHIVPADDVVKSTLKRVRRGDIVTFDGKLVRIIGKDGWRWISSTSRGDTGDHSCEVVWVENFEITTPEGNF